MTPRRASVGALFLLVTSASLAGTVPVDAPRGAMRALGVPLAARNELLDILAPINRDVVKL